MKIMREALFVSAAVFGLVAIAAAPVTADQVILDDLIVDGSICVGFDCVNGESFGFDTLRLKENNLRIKFQDTSTSASFPSADWQITANDSSNGGANKFSIECIQDGGCGGQTPFTIRAGAPSNSIFVNSSGRVGFGTNTPTVDLHVKTGNTPTLRLEQDGSSGFTAQTFDVAANEANFFIRDVTNGSTLPLRIKPGAPSNALFISAGGSLGINAGTSPDAKLHVKATATGFGTDGVAHIESTANEDTFLKLENSNATNRIVGVSFANSSGNEWRFQEGAAGAVFNITRVASGGNEITVNERLDGAGPATLVVDGSVNATNVAFPSSRELKTDFQALNVQDVLARVAGLEMTSWRFKEGPAVRHIGPIAEDFHAAFPLAPSNKVVSAIDVSGVALAAIQGLSQELLERDATIRELLARVAALEAKLAP